MVQFWSRKTAALRVNGGRGRGPINSTYWRKFAAVCVRPGWYDYAVVIAIGCECAANHSLTRSHGNFPRILGPHMYEVHELCGTFRRNLSAFSIHPAVDIGIAATGSLADNCGLNTYPEQRDAD